MSQRAVARSKAGGGYGELGVGEEADLSARAAELRQVGCSNVWESCAWGLGGVVSGCVCGPHVCEECVFVGGCKRLGRGVLWLWQLFCMAPVAWCDCTGGCVPLMM